MPSPCSAAHSKHRPISRFSRETERGLRERRCRVEVLRMSTEPRRHFSMLRDFRAADFFTLGNGFAGSGAILAFMRYCAGEQARFFWIGTALIPVALVMDILDGR